MSKASVRVGAYGAVDELGAALGMALATPGDPQIGARLAVIQHDLFALGASLATPPARSGRRRPVTPEVPGARIGEMEAWIDEAVEELPPIREFVLPGGTARAAALHLCRTVCRRAERDVVRLQAEETIAEDVLPYLNRLSDLFFTLARLENARAGADEVVWSKDP